MVLELEVITGGAGLDIFISVRMFRSSRIIWLETYQGAAVRVLKSILWINTVFDLLDQPQS